jgi:hypothetical protein
MPKVVLLGDTEPLTESNDTTPNADADDMSDADVDEDAEFEVIDVEAEACLEQKLSQSSASGDEAV